MSFGRIDWPSLAVRLFEVGGKKTYHVSELVELADTLSLKPMGMTADEMERSLSSFLSRNVKSKAPQFSRQKNKTGGCRRGVYRIRPQKRIDFTPKELPQVSSGFTGAAGEFAVLSELLFRGYNASKMTVDDGIDVVASKDDKYFHIQVKTANYADGKPYQATIRQETFTHATNVFYIVVLREPTPVGFINRFVIFPSSDIRRWKSQGILKGETTISLRIGYQDQKFLLANSIDVTNHINDFESIV
jgi:hypothetical protein